MGKIQDLDWSLVVATYKRETILPQCLNFAAKQTLPPKEIIVVDASPYWEKTYTQIMSELAEHYPMINWQYVQAKRPSLTAQRNQGIKLASSDILFLIDDDTFMYPDCAKEIMQIYALDTEHKVVGMMPFLEPLPPNTSQKTNKSIQKNYQLHTLLNKKMQRAKFRLKSFILGLLKDSHIFPVYNTSKVKYSLSQSLENQNVNRVPGLQGYGMTFRRELFDHIQFEEILEYYAIPEDTDFSFRAAQLGILLRVLNARIYHMKAPGGRLSRFTVEALSALNMAALHRLHNSNFEHFKTIYPHLLRRRLIALTLKDILALRWLLPSTRGIVFAFRHYQEIFSKNPEELRYWYPQFQRALIDKKLN